jgi:DNA-binding CsgD family transcriptional regulator
LAETLFGDGLELSHGALRCVHPIDSAALDNLIARLGRSSGLNESDVPSPVVVRRPLKRPLVVHGVHLKGMASAVFSPARSILLISDTGVPAAGAPVDVIRQAFGLTPAEAALVAHLERELPLSAAAELMGISVETARSHLKRVFGKTDTNRQSDLLRLIGRLHPSR